MSTTTYQPRLRAAYNDEIKAALQAELELPNVMMVPRIEKIVLNMGVGEAAGSAKLIDGS